MWVDPGALVCDAAQAGAAGRHVAFCACSQAPIFEMEFFQGFVRPSLHDAFTGWGEALRGGACTGVQQCSSGQDLL